MILLQKNQSNLFAVTLSELSNPNLPSNWLFRFNIDQEEDAYEYLLFLTDESTATQRYNLFNLIEGTDVVFQFIGDYHYRCYQMPDTDDTDFTRGTLVEEGKMRLTESEVATPTFEATIETPIYDSTDIS